MSQTEVDLFALRDRIERLECKLEALLVRLAPNDRDLALLRGKAIEALQAAEKLAEYEALRRDNSLMREELARLVHLAKGRAP